MTDLSTTPFGTCRRLMSVVEIFGTGRGSIDARDPHAISISFPATGLGHPRAVADSALRSFRNAGYDLVSDASNDDEVRFVLSDPMAA